MSDSPAGKPRSFRKTYLLEYPPEVVYRAWISETTIIAPASKMEISPKQGGVYRLIMGEDATMEGRFTEVVPGERLSYSWHWAGSDEHTEVHVAFNRHPAGSEIQVSHHGFTSEDSLRNHTSGWDSYVNGLRKHLASA